MEKLSRKEFLKSLGAVGGAAILGSACAGNVPGESALAGVPLTAIEEKQSRYFRRLPYRLLTTLYAVRVDVGRRIPIVPTAPEVQMRDEAIQSHLEWYRPRLAEVDSKNWGALDIFDAFWRLEPRDRTLDRLNGMVLSQDRANDKFTERTLSLLRVEDREGARNLSGEAIAEKLTKRADSVRLDDPDFRVRDSLRALPILAVNDNDAARTMFENYRKWVALAPTSLFPDELERYKSFILAMDQPQSAPVAPKEPIVGRLAAIANSESLIESTYGLTRRLTDAYGAALPDGNSPVRSWLKGDEDLAQIVYRRWLLRYKS